MPRSPMGFFYHIVSDQDLPHVKHLYPYKSPRSFETDLVDLKRRYSLVGYDALQKHVDGTEPLPENAAFISFDDGFVECFTVVRPILMKHQIPCLFFLTTGWIDNRGLYYRGKMSLAIDQLVNLSPGEQRRALETLNRDFRLQLSNPADFISWLLPHQRSDEPLIDQVCQRLDVDPEGFLAKHQPFLSQAQIQKMREEGFIFGAHTRHHQKLAFLPPEEQMAAIAESCQEVAEITGDAQVPFAFPFSGDGVDRQHLADLRATQPQVGLIFDTKKLRRDVPFVFQRIWVDRPVPGTPAQKNLDHWLHDAYIRAVTEA